MRGVLRLAANRQPQRLLQVPAPLLAALKGVA